MSEFIKEIKLTLAEELKYVKNGNWNDDEYDTLRKSQGWIEALEYVINTYNNYNNN